MTDKELLQLAAKAAGLKCKWFKVKQWSLTGRCKICTGTINVFGTHHAKPWNPLTDDGDALRLAVKLEIDVTHYQNSVEAIAWLDGELSDFISEEIATCRISATRRAIVRAAAAIGAKL